MMVGPCSVEKDLDGLLRVAEAAKEMGCQFLRGGAFKPRTSPYDFQGLEEKALEYLAIAREKTGLLVVTELMDTADINLVCNYADVIQIGARNMQNFELLKEVGKTGKPILLKRGLANTLQELLMSAEYIMSEGNEQVILCERGIRSYDSYTRNVLDLAAVPVLKELTHLPIVVDPSHATGVSRLVRPMACAATAAGADGLIIEVHNNPVCALCDGAQSLTPEQFDEVAQRVGEIRSIMH
jgi:3-deoxy-7-phosphoheptulonate synthase